MLKDENMDIFIYVTNLLVKIMINKDKSIFINKLSSSTPEYQEGTYMNSQRISQIPHQTSHHILK